MRRSPPYDLLRLQGLSFQDGARGWLLIGEPDSLLLSSTWGHPDEPPKVIECRALNRSYLKSSSTRLSVEALLETNHIFLIITSRETTNGSCSLHLSDSQPTMGSSPSRLLRSRATPDAYDLVSTLI